MYQYEVFVLIGDGEFVGSIRLLAMFNQNPFPKIPEITSYLVLPKIDCVLLQANCTPQQLASDLRQQFKIDCFSLYRLRKRMACYLKPPGSSSHPPGPLLRSERPTNAGAG